MDSLASLDAQIATWLQGSGTASLTAFMLLVSLLHTHAAVLGIAAALALVFWLRGEKRWVLATFVVVPGGMAFNALLKELIQRPRPVYEFPLVTLETYSFPSGHTAAATLLYGLLAAYLVRRTPSRSARAAIALGALALVALVGFSRMYLGAHYLTDVVAAASVALAWVALSLWFVHGRFHAARSG